MNDNVLINVTDLKKHYNGGTVKALNGLNCEVKNGEVVVVIGPSGCGNQHFCVRLTFLKCPLPVRFVLTVRLLQIPKPT